VTTVRVRMWRFTCFLLIEATGNTRQTGGLFCVSLQCEREQTSPLFPTSHPRPSSSSGLHVQFRTSLDAMPLQDSGSIHAARICAGRKIAPPETRLSHHHLGNATHRGSALGKAIFCGSVVVAPRGLLKETCSSIVGYAGGSTDQPNRQRPQGKDHVEPFR
jgi:hypothetical protein